MGFINIVEGDLVITEEELWGYEKVALVTHVDNETCPARIHVLYDYHIWTTWEDEVEIVYAAPRPL